jgi:hypothetical protein
MILLVDHLNLNRFVIIYLNQLINFKHFFHLGIISFQT